MRTTNRLFLLLSPVLALAACPSPAGDPVDETGETSGDGDGDPATGDGDGDGDPATGDGDGDATGDGDGDPGTPSSATLFFAEGVDPATPRELFMVEVTQDGPATPVSLFTADPEGGIGIARLSPDASYYSFGAWTATDQAGYILPTDSFPPGPPVRYDVAPVPEDSLTTGLVFSPDSSRLTFLAGAYPDPVPELYMAEIIDGAPGVPAVFNAPFADGGGVASGARYADDGTMLAYEMDALGEGVSQIFVGGADPADAGQAVQVSAVPAELGAGAYEFKPDASALYYSHSTGLETPEWFVVDLSGDEPGAPATVNGPVETTIRSRISADGDRFLYWTGDGLVGDLYLVEVPGATPGPAVKLNVATDVYPKYFEFVDDAGTQVTYVRSGPEGRYSVLVDVADGSPGQEYVLNGPEVEGGDASEPRLVGERLFYFSAPEGLGAELYVVDLSTDPPGEPVKLSAELVPGGYLSSELIVAADADIVLYTGTQDTTEHQQLYGVELAAPGESFVVNHGLDAGEDVNFGARISSDGRFVLFTTMTGPQTPRPLYVVDLVADGPGVSTLLSDPALAVSRVTLVP